MPQLILASASPARLALLRSAMIEPDLIVPADIDETPLTDEPPTDYVLRVSKDKATTIAARYPNSIIIAADSVVILDNRIIGKPRDKNHAREILRDLSGTQHYVITGLHILDQHINPFSQSIETTIDFADLTEHDIERYLATNDWQGKAGAFGIQGVGSAFIKTIHGSYSSVVGLPLHEVRVHLKNIGYLAE